MTLHAQLDCSFPDDPKVIEAGPLAELLYVRSVLFARAQLTDGVINKFNLPRIALGIPKPMSHVAALVKVGLWDETDCGWCIPEHAWRRWNPTKTEVDEARRAEAERKQSYRDKLRRDAYVPTGHEQNPNGTKESRVPPATKTRKQPEPEPEPEPLDNPPTPHRGVRR